VTSDDGTSIVSMQKETSAAEAKSTSSLSDRRPNDLSISISDEEGIPSEFSPDDPLLSPLSSSTFSPENSDDEDGMKGNVETTDPSNREEMKAVEEEILTREDPTIDKEEREVPHRTEEMSLTPLPHTTNLPSSTSMGSNTNVDMRDTITSSEAEKNNEGSSNFQGLPEVLRVMPPDRLQALVLVLDSKPELKGTLMSDDGNLDWEKVAKLVRDLEGDQDVEQFPKASAAVAETSPRSRGSAPTSTTPSIPHTLSETNIHSVGGRSKRQRDDKEGPEMLSGPHNSSSTGASANPYSQYENSYANGRQESLIESRQVQQIGSRKNTPCKFFGWNKCRNGDKCPFGHFTMFEDNELTYKRRKR